MSTSTPLTVVASFHAKPSSADALRRALEALLAPTRAEPGCLSYRFYVDPVDPTAMVMVEEWVDQEAINRHNESPHLRELLSKVPDLVSEPPSIKVLRPVGE